MTTATVRDLRYDFPAVLSRVSRGESIAITKRGKVVARLMPPVGGKVRKVKFPNFLARIREVHGDRKPGNFVQWFIENRD